MKADSVGWEIWIELSHDEISKLTNKLLKGKIKVRNRETCLGDFDLELMVGQTNQNQAFLELKTQQEKVYFEEVQEYKVILSQEGYKSLKQYGSIGDRMYFNPGCKVSVCRE